jgi:hypothetical protein
MAQAEDFQAKQRGTGHQHGDYSRNWMLTQRVN